MADQLTEKLYATDDAMVWAEEFCKLFDGRTIVNRSMNLPQDVVDAGTMVSWFANAMQIAVNHYERKKMKENSPDV